MGKDNGGAAFPCERDRGDKLDSSEGMTLRDYFAAKAMLGIVAGVHPICNDDDPPPVVARTAYKMADAMLAARNAGD